MASALLAVLLLATGCRRTPPPPTGDPATGASAAVSASGTLATGAPAASGSANGDPAGGDPAGGATADGSPAASGSADGAAEAAPADGPEAALARASVQGDDIVRRTLFVWVTAEQVTALRRDRLLVEALRPSGAPGLDRAVKKAQDPTTLQLMRVLARVDRRPVGLAWSNPWGTARRLEGARLVKITLRPDAVIGRYDPSQPRPWRFVDGAGAEVAAGKVMAHPDRLGAIFHVTPTATGVSRGVALASEPAIASWSLETAAIDAELDRAATLLETLTVADAEPDAWPPRTEAAWRTSAASYEGSLTVAAGYEPGRRAELAARLRRARGSTRPLTVKPSAAAPGSGPFADLLDRGVQRQVCTEHGDKTRCAPLPPKSRRAHDGRFCVNENGGMMDCPPRR